MQNKTAIWVFAVLLAVACLYQLSFTWVTSGVENEASSRAQVQLDSVIEVDGEIEDEAERTRLKDEFEAKYLIGQTDKPAYPVFGHTYQYCKKRELNLGLDLQGGMNVTLEVSLVGLIEELADDSNNEVFKTSLKNALERQRDSQEDFVTLFAEEWAKADPGGSTKMASVFHHRETTDLIPANASDEEVIDIIRTEANDAVGRTEQVLRKRIDNLGVVQPKIQRVDGGRILVELPGVKDKQRVRKILQGTAKLEFWETYDNSEVYPILENINKQLALENKADGGDSNDGGLVPDGDQSADTDSSAADLTETPDTNSTNDGLLAEIENDSIPNDSNLSAAEIAANNPLFSILNPVIADRNGQTVLQPGPAVGIALTTDTAKVNELLNRPSAKELIRAELGFRWGARAINEAGTVVYLYAIKTNAEGIAPLEGDKVTNARQSADALGNPEVELIMNSEGAQIWATMTKNNVDKSIAIVLDNLVYSAPNVLSEISGGISSISNIGEVEEAKDLASVLKAGKLPAPAEIIEEAVVGPSLGQEAIQSGLRSFGIALLVILVYMALYYSRSGIVADIALLANLFFVMGVLASLGATLTLPGIAGIVLTIGMSVDANVLIYERIREELSEGKGLRLAIVDGYKAAYSSIIDANITTLLTGIVLAVFGSGPIKGFATTLIIGILTSLFSAIFITRLVFEWQLDRKAAIKFATKLTEGAFKNVNFAFVARRRIFYAVSGLIIAAGIVSFATNGLDLGVDFTGGRSYQVRFDQPAQTAEIRSALEQVFVDENGLKMPPEVKTFGDDNQVMITTKYRINEKGQTIDDEIEGVLYDQLVPFFETPPTKAEFIDSDEAKLEGLMRSQTVGPTIADDIKTSAFWAVGISLIMIFLYIVMRFRKWQFGLGALVAMFHDVLVVLSLFSLLYRVLPFSLEIDQAFIAAILTVVGYSINDTVVVFDRIREHLGLYKRKEFSEILDGALNSTLSRTFNTSISTFFVLLMIFIFGGEVIRGFVFALMIGVVVGTYSSLCVATPIVLDLNKPDAPAKAKK